MKKLFAFLLLASAFSFASADDKKTYDESANAKEQVEVALKAAKAANKSALIVFGANWCGDCKMLDIEMHQGTLAKLVNERLVVVKVDVGRFDRNKDVTAVYGNVVKKGIPSVVLLRADGTVAYQTDGGELADARKMGREGVTQFFAAMLEKTKASR
ncbi:MAG: thioredoxin family protein [Burkholderiales bacterium]|nr:thioredoxin family protein [Burkholderiales bacterium]